MGGAVGYPHLYLQPLLMRWLPAHLLQEVHCQNGGEAQLERENDGGDNDEGARG